MNEEDKKYYRKLFKLIARAQHRTGKRMKKYYERRRWLRRDKRQVKK